VGHSKLKVVVVSALLTIALMLSICYVFTSKPSITEATYQELVDMPYIGVEKAKDIVNYCEINKNAHTDDLIVINGIGEDTIRVLKERWK